MAWEDKDNFIIVPTEEDAEEIIYQYAEMALHSKTKEDFQELFEMYHEELTMLIKKEFHTNLALKMVELIKKDQKDIDEYRGFGED